MYNAVVIQKVLKRRWEPWRWEVGWPTIGSWQWPIKSLSKLFLLQLHEKLPKNSTLTILQSFSIWFELERWKRSISGCLMSWLKIKNIVILNVSFSFSMQKHKPFLHHIVIYNTKWILYDSWWQPAQWLDWEEAPKHFPKPNLHQKKIKLVVCLANGHDVLKTVMPAASLGQKKGLSSSQCLNIHCTINAPKVEHIRLQSFASYAISIWPLTN